MSLFKQYMEAVQTYNEASPIEFSELPAKAKTVLKTLSLKDCNCYHGIHGYVANVNETSLDEKKLNAITSIPGFRFIRLKSNGRDMDKTALDKFIKKTGTINIIKGSIHF